MDFRARLVDAILLPNIANHFKSAILSVCKQLSKALSGELDKIEKKRRFVQISLFWVSSDA
jgi:hypothetical protein